ncbi:MAG: hypothetical protein AAF738_03320 [Bacteroidota bacterium]
MLNDIQKYLNKRKLHKQAKPSKRQAISLSDAKWIGVLFDATSIEHIEATQKYVAQLRSVGKHVKLLAYVADKSKDIELPFPFFSATDVNLLRVPSGKKVEDFITQTFDILLVLHPKATILFEYIATLTDARLKVGPFSRSKNTFDLMIDVNSQSALHYFINQVEFFAGKLQPKKSSANTSKKRPATTVTASNKLVAA